jgi:hypothetical protein
VQIADPAEPVRTDRKTCNQISEQQWLLEKLRHQRHQPGSNDADGDVGAQSVFHGQQVSRANSHPSSDEFEKGEKFKTQNLKNAAKAETRDGSPSPRPTGRAGVRGLNS